MAALFFVGQSSGILPAVHNLNSFDTLRPPNPFECRGKEDELKKFSCPDANLKLRNPEKLATKFGGRNLQFKKFVVPFQLRNKIAPFSQSGTKQRELDEERNILQNYLKRPGPEGQQLKPFSTESTQESKLFNASASASVHWSVAHYRLATDIPMPE